MEKELVLLTVGWYGYSRDEVEEMVIEKEVFDKHQESLRDVLDGLTWNDFDGKHGHKESEYSHSELSLKEAVALYNSGDLQDNFSECNDSLMDNLGQDKFQEILNSNARAYTQIIQQNNIKSIRFDLDGCDDPEKFYKRLEQLTDFYGVKIINKN